MEKKTTVQIRMRYEWDGSAASRLRKPIEDHLVPALPGATYVSGSVMYAASAPGEFERQADFNSVPDWLDALGELATSWRLWLSQGSTTLELNIGADGITVGIRGEEARAVEMRAHLEQFAASAGLKPKKPLPLIVTPPRTSDFSRTGNYRLLEELTAPELLQTVELFRTWLGEWTFNGSIATKADPGTTHDIRDFEVWKESVSTQWADLATASINVFGRGRSAYLRVQFKDRTVDLNLRAEDEGVVRAVYTAFEKILKVAPRVAGVADTKFAGERKRYYTIDPITEEWVQRKMLAMLGRVAAKRSDFGGTFRIANQEYTVQDFDAWMKEVAVRWADMDSAGGWISTTDSRQQLDVDFKREQVTVDLRSRSAGTGPAVMTFGDYESELKLTAAPANPYQYFRFGSRYQKTDEWNNGTDLVLADAIEKSIAAAFGDDGRYVFMNASTTEGEAAEVQTPYSGTAEFFARLRNGVPYVRASIYIQGPRGCDLAVQLRRGEKEVTLRSSITDASRFKSVAAPFDKIPNLKEYDAERRNAAGEVQAKPSKVVTFMPLIAGLPGLLLALVALMVGLLPAQKSSLEILAPKDAAEIPGRSCRLVWAVTRKTIVHGETSETPAANVLVTKEGDPAFKFDPQNASSGLTISFPSDGVYDVTVSVPSVQERNVRVTVKTPSAEASKTIKKK